MTGPDPVLTQARTVAIALLGAPAEVDCLLSGGRNSRVCRVRCGSQSFVLKQYPSRGEDPRDRLSAEVGALRLMELGKVNDVPRVIAVDREHGYALLTWIDGSAVGDVADADIDAALAFLGAIHALRQLPGAADRPLAAEACLSGAEIERQINARLVRLQGLASQEPELVEFLDESFIPLLRRLIADARSMIYAAGVDYASDLPPEERSLVPSDFGFHNSLRRPNGTLAFIDFEYFGWDDPVKLTADILLHPGMTLSASQRQHFRRGAEQLYGEGSTFGRRLDAYQPLFGLRWILILLNEFIPERWQHRLLAGATESWQAAKARQLARARDMATSLSRQGEN